LTIGAAACDPLCEGTPDHQHDPGRAASASAGLIVGRAAGAKPAGAELRRGARGIADTRSSRNATMLTVQFVGSGDAFGSGGRFQACISVRAANGHVLLDCGASSLVALRRLGLEPASVDAVVVSHLHGDHFGGIPFLVLDQQFARRERPLVVAGPPGLRERAVQAMEVLFPGSSRVERRFELRLIELPEGVATRVGPVDVTAYPVVHASGAPAYGLRLACDGKVVAYSGDTEWTDALIGLAGGADLFICEAYVFEKTIKYHLSYTALARHRARLACRRLVLTHMSADMLDRRTVFDEQVAEDGLVLTL
jgi:ribonuclease BN (tRNA processing enzyme)